MLCHMELGITAAEVKFTVTINVPWMSRGHFPENKRKSKLKRD